MTSVTIDLTDEISADASRAALTALDEGKLRRLMRLVRAAVSDVNDAAMLATIRGTLAEEYWWVSDSGEYAEQPANPDLPNVALMPLPVGVVFNPDRDDDCLAEDGQVVFEDGRVVEMNFDLAELFAEEFGHRSSPFTLGVDLDAGVVDDGDYPGLDVRERFEVKPAPNDWSAATVLAGVRTALAAHGGQSALSVVFPHDGAQLRAEDACVAYADGSTSTVDLSAVSIRLTNDYSHAAAGRPLVVDLRADAVTYWAD